MNRLMIVGPSTDAKNGKLYGGTTVLTKLFLDFMDETDTNYVFVQTNRYVNLKTGKRDVFRSSLAFFSEYFARLPFVDTVMFNFSDHAVVSLFPALSAVARALGKKVVLRKFGGSFDLYLEKVSERKRRRALSAIEQADLVFFETKAGIEHIKKSARVEGKIQWFPNVRRRTNVKKDPDDFNNKLVFISHIKDEKGVGDILKIAQALKGKFSFNLYGSIKEDKYRNFDWTAYGVNYHGILATEKVPDILKDSLLLLLLTSYREGYPGIVIEALSVGLPVLATDVGGIPEMITDGVEGIIVSPGDVDTACRRLNELTPDRYKMMCEAALRTFNEKFEAKRTNQRILKEILSIR